MKLGLRGFSLSSPSLLFFFPSPTRVSRTGVGKTLEGFSRDSCPCLSAIRRERKASSQEEVLACLSALLLRLGSSSLLSVSRSLNRTLSAGRGKRVVRGLTEEVWVSWWGGAVRLNALWARRVGTGVSPVEGRFNSRTGESNFSPCAPGSRRAHLRGPRRSSPAPGQDAYARATGGSQGARARWLLGTAGERRGVPGELRGAGAARGAGPQRWEDSGRLPGSRPLLSPSPGGGRDLAAYFEAVWGCRQ